MTISISSILLILTTTLFFIPLRSASADELDAKVENLLQKMTLEEKVGQMTQVTIQVVSRKAADGQHELDPARLYDAIVTHQVGSILNVYPGAYSLEHWHEIITQIQDLATQKTRLGIPVLYGIDAIHGANYTRGATLFPQSIGMAATWNPDLVRKEGEITALEVRASGIPWNFNPVLGVGRQPLWPRFFETYGEDPYLVSVMGQAYIKGLEGADNDISQPTRVAACMKHYLGYSFPLSGQDRTPAWIPERMLREIFLPPFRVATEAGVHTLMVNSSEINGIPVHASKPMLTDLLRQELGFRGVVVTDWYDIINLYEREKVVASRKEAVKQAVLAGIDMSMVPFDFSFYDDLLALVREGEIPETRIDQSVRRILRLKYELGLFEHPYPDPALKPRFASESSRQVALQAARESLTLLKNRNRVLPLSRHVRVLVTGPTADLLSPLNGGWSFTWQGNDESYYPPEKLTIREAIEQKIGPDRVVYLPGSGFDRAEDLSAVTRAARQVDVVILCLGEPAYCETPGNISDLHLPAAQYDLARAVSQAGVPVVLVLAEGRPRLIHPIVEQMDAVVMAYLPGLEGGPAIADLLFGEVNPSGKLPFTYPKYPNKLICYDYKNSENTKPNRFDPEFPFGFGLSYTKFRYDNLRLNKKVLRPGETLEVRVSVKNVGQRAGKEAVLLYLSDLVRSVTPPVRQLKRFTKIHLRPGEAREVVFRLQDSDLQFIGTDNRPTLEAGEFRITVGGLQQTFRLIK